MYQITPATYSHRRILYYILCAYTEHFHTQKKLYMQHAEITNCNDLQMHNKSLTIEVWVNISHWSDYTMFQQNWTVSLFLNCTELLSVDICWTSLKPKTLNQIPTVNSIYSSLWYQDTCLQDIVLIPIVLSSFYY